LGYRRIFVSVTIGDHASCLFAGDACKGDLWIARADGADRLIRGRFTLPAWSDDGRLIAVAERKDEGTRWDISVVRVPERFRK
jgi:hypothetical protein